MNITVDDFVRCGGALLVVLGGASLLGAVLLARGGDDLQPGLTIAVAVPMLAIVIVALALQEII